MFTDVQETHNFLELECYFLPGRYVYCWCAYFYLFGNWFWYLQMRLNKVSELIHNSTNHQNLDSAGVSVHFQEILDLVISTYF